MFYFGVRIAIVFSKKANITMWAFTFASQLLFSSISCIFCICIGVCFYVACVIFVSIDFGLCHWKVHSPHDLRRQKTVGRPSARRAVLYLRAF